MNYDLQVLLKNHKKRNTPSKQLIFQLLNNHETITTRELYDQVADTMDETTFYRVIKQFYELKVIKDCVINGVRKIELADQFNSHHHHMICVRCGDVVNINDIKLEQYLKLLAARKGYLHRNHSFEIQGVCPACSPRYQKLSHEAGVE